MNANAQNFLKEIQQKWDGKEFSLEDDGDEFDTDTVTVDGTDVAFEQDNELVFGIEVYKNLDVEEFVELTTHLGFEENKDFTLPVARGDDEPHAIVIRTYSMLDHKGICDLIEVVAGPDPFYT